MWLRIRLIFKSTDRYEVKIINRDILVGHPKPSAEWGVYTTDFKSVFYCYWDKTQTLSQHNVPCRRQDLKIESRVVFLSDKNRFIEKVVGYAPLHLRLKFKRKGQPLFVNKY